MTHYEVRAIDVVASAPGVLVREFTFAPGEATPWHRHSQVSDRCYGLAGEIVLERRAGAPQPIGPGDRCDVAPGEIHRLINRGEAEARLLLVQSGGRYDFIEEA
jgi:quercetin dioxygenase-like cupin family protein